VSKRFISAALALTILIGLMPYLGILVSVKAVNGLENGTVIYYEDFDYADVSDKDKVLSVLGWSEAEEYLYNYSDYSIENGRLLCDNTSSYNAYLTVLDNTAMSEAAKGDYTISYKLNYVSSTDYTAYSSLIYNYNGNKTYNTVHLRVAGTAYNQGRGYNWYNYDDAIYGTGTSSVSYKLFGVSALTANASSPTAYPLVGREVTVRIAVDIDAGPTVYMNGVKVSSPNGKYKDVFMATEQYASAIGLKTAAGVKAYMDDFMVYTGLGDIPANVNKEDISYVTPKAPDYGNTIDVMSYNVYYISQSTVALADGLNRTTHLYNVISGYHPDIVGFQERTEANKTGITNLLSTYTNYKVVDEYRTDTSVAYVHHHAPIMYNSDRLTVESNTAANNNMGHGAWLYRDCYEVRDLTESQFASFSPGKSMSWAVFKDNVSGSYILAMNTHFSLRLSSYVNYTAEDAINDRLANAETCLGVMEKVFDVYGVIPVVYTGDFNMYSFDPSYKRISEELSDTLHGSEDFIKYEYSMNSITTPDLVEVPDLPIDHIFYNTEALTAVGYQVCNGAAEIRIASDHLPILGTFSIKETSAPVCSHITGVYDTPQTVTMKGDGEIFYTTDGSDPITSDTRKLYPGIISVTEDTVLKYCALKNGVYSNVQRVTLYFGTPLYITEVTKNSPGNDMYEGVEIINVSNVPVDLFDFVIWNYSDSPLSNVTGVADSTVILQMKMASVEGQYVLPSGGIGFCPTVNTTMYKNKDQYAAGKSDYLVTLNGDGTKVTYHTDRFAAAIAYDGSGSISPDRIFVIDRTARSMGYTVDGTLVKRADYYSSDGVTVNNLYRSFNLSNSTYTKLYITLSTAQYVNESVTTCILDGTDGGTTTASDGTTTVLEGSYHFTPNGKTLMTTQSFTKSGYSIGYLNAAQQSAYDKIIAIRRGKASVAVSTAEEFAAMSADGSYCLTSDITLTSSYPAKFTGVLDGNGHTVTTSAPMFADLSGTVKNVALKGEISGSGYNGAIAAESTGGARLEKVTVNVKLYGGTVTGGLIGYVGDGVKTVAVDCVNYGDVSGTSQSGGLFGYVLGSALVMDGCINKGRVSSDSYSGGLVARFGKDASTIKYVCNISNSVNYGEVLSDSSRAGGILAYSAGNTSIAGCDNYGYVHFSKTNTNSMAGGIYGAGTTTYTSGGTEYDTVNAFTISDCYNYGNVEATTNAGGILGRGPNHATPSGYAYTIISCGNSGDIVTTDAGSTYGTKGAGGIVGYVYGGYSGNGNGIYNCYNVGKVTAVGGDSGVKQHACGIAAFLSGTTAHLKNCYNAGEVTCSGNNVGAYQLYYNNDTTGSPAAYVSNNYALYVSGASYELNGTQSASYKTFTVSELSAGTVRSKLNSGAGNTLYYQSSEQVYPVHKRFFNNLKNGIILGDNTVYAEDGEFVYRVKANTTVRDFQSNFATEVKVVDCNGEAVGSLPVSTGHTVTSFDGSKSMTVVVIGDVDGNGTVSATDYINVKGYIKNTTSLDKVQKNAADVDDSGEISSSDYVSLKLMLSR